MSTIVKQQYGKKIDATGAIQIFHFETDSDMVLIEGEVGVTLSQKLASLVKNRTISLSGGVTGSATYNGVDSVSIDVEVGDDSHEHTGATIKVGTAGRVVITGEDESLNISAITETELGYLSGLTSNIQNQLNSKALSDHNHDAIYLKQILLGANSGIAPLDENGKILAQYLPSYVDDVIEGSITNDDFTEFTDTNGIIVTPEAGKLYNDINANQMYRWGGTHYASVGGAGGGIALGETATTAYRGDRGKIAYEHSQSAHAPSNATVVTASDTNGNVIIDGNEVIIYTHPTHTARASGLYKITVDDKGHVTAVTAITKEDITGLGIPGAATTLSDLGITATADELNYMDGVTSNVQTQLGDKYSASTSRTANTVLAAPNGSDGAATFRALVATDIPSLAASKITSGTFAVARIPVMTAATADAAGTAGAVPAPAAGKQASFLRGDGTWVVPTNTKNTAGSTNSSSKLFLIGAASQAANPQTYSHDTAYIGTDGCLYSNGTRVVNVATGSTQPTNQLAGDLWFETIS